MRHFNYLNKDELSDTFYQLPSEITRDSDREVLALALGSLLYMPATKSGWAKDLIESKHDGLAAMVLDLEDALRDDDLDMGISNILEGFSLLEDSGYDIPLIFIRVREHTQMRVIVGQLGSSLSYLTGFILPKFNTYIALHSLSEVDRLNEEYGITLYAMPILESKEIMYKENRIHELLSMKAIIDEYRSIVLNIRVGATDFTSLFGIRRTVDNTVYDMSVIRDCLVDIVNVFGREDNGYVISGPVWEFFEGKQRVLKPQLRENLFLPQGEEGKAARRDMLNKYVDGLVKEIVLDKINGFHGKTIIHPTHIKPVNALMAVSYEEYADAYVIVNGDTENGGVLKSEFGNKMNEVKPHMNWANKVLTRAKIYGVLNDGKTFIDLI